MQDPLFLSFVYFRTPLNYLVMIVTLAITVLVMVTWEEGPYGQPL